MQQSDTGLLFDIDHARARCFHTGEKLEEYVSKLPMHLMKELHMSGAWGELEAHMYMLDRDWEVFEWLLQNIADKTWPEPVLFTYEYGGVGGRWSENSDQASMQRDVPKFCDLMRRYGLRE